MVAYHLLVFLGNKAEKESLIPYAHHGQMTHVQKEFLCVSKKRYCF